MADSTRIPAIQPTFTWMRQRLSRIVAFGFGAGLIKPAPGTWGTLLAWLLWPVVAAFGSSAAIGFFLILAFALGVWACERAGEELGVQDYGGFVWDEMVAFWIVLWMIPESVGAQAVAFVLFRAFDILKPAPIGYLDRRFKHGFGAMLDDVMAAVYTILAFAVLNAIFG